MAMNMDAVLRIAAKVSGGGELNALQRSLGNVETAAKATAKSFDNVVSSKVWQASAVGAGAFAVALGASVKAAIDFESSMADVRKVVSGLETPAALAEIKSEILDLSTEMPVTARGFAEIYAAAGQSGIAREELREFATMVGKVSIAFDMTAQEAGTALAQMKVALGLSNKEVESLADSMNYLSDNTGSTAAKLVEFISRAGAAGKIAGLSGEETIAFGAAMIQAGVQTEVAATSFNIMLRALSAGTNMTDRQATALEKLGYAFQPAVVATRDYTREAETQSRARLSAARDESDQRLTILRNETDKMSREIDRRYRQIKQQLEDQWEDERDARDDAMAQASRQASKAMQREQQLNAQEINDRYDANLKLELDRFKDRTDAMAEAEQDAIRKRYRDARQQEMQSLDDQYEAKREVIDQQQREEQKMLRRADRDKQQEVMEGLQSRQEAEDEANKRRLKEAEKVEGKQIEALEESERQKIEVVRQKQKEAETAQKEQAESAADAWKLSFAERLQKDGSGFLMEILRKIAALPKGEQLSALTGLFGEEARGLAPLLGNLDELQRALQLATDKAGAAGSVTREYGVRSETTANQLQLLANKQQRLAIETGEKALPAVSKLTGELDRMLGAIMGFTDRFPGATTALIGFGAAISALVLAAPGIMATITMLKGAAVIIGGLNIGGLIAGWAPVIMTGLLKIVAVITAIGPLALQAFTLAFAPVLTWMGTILVPALLAFFSGPVGWTVLAVAAVVAMAIAFREPIMKFLMWLPGAFQEGLNTAWQIIKSVFTSIGEGFGLYVVNPIRSTWAAMVEFLPKAMASVADTVKGVWTNIINGIRSAFNGFLQGIANGVNSVANQINRLINSYNNLARNVGGPQVPFVPQLNIPQFATGGFVRRPTMAVIGEGGEPEYVVPQSKAMSFANNIVAGRTGEQALKARQTWTDQMQIGHLAPKGGFTSNLEKLAALRQQGIRATFSPMTGLVVSRRAPLSTGRPPGRSSVAFSNPMANMNTTQVKSLGPVQVQQNLRIDRVERRSDGDYLTLAAAEKLAAEASTNAVNQVVKLLQQPSFRREVGIS